MFLAHSLKYKACVTYNSCRTRKKHAFSSQCVFPKYIMMISVDMSVVISTNLWWKYTAVPAVHESRLILINHAANFLLDPRHVGLPFFSPDMRVLREARCSVILPSGKKNISCSPGHLSSSRPLSVTLICAFTEWRSCPQPVLVLGYLGKGTDPRIERTPLETLFRATLNVRFTLAVLLSSLLE